LKPELGRGREKGESALQGKMREKSALHVKVRGKNVLQG